MALSFSNDQVRFLCLRAQQLIPQPAVKIAATSHPPSHIAYRSPRSTGCAMPQTSVRTAPQAA